MTQQEFEDLIEQLEAYLEEAKELLRQAEKDGNKRMINQAQKDITRAVRKMIQIKADWRIAS